MYGTCHSCLSPSTQECEDAYGCTEAVECSWRSSGGHPWGIYALINNNYVHRDKTALDNTKFNMVIKCNNFCYVHASVQFVWGASRYWLGPILVNLWTFMHFALCKVCFRQIYWSLVLSSLSVCYILYSNFSNVYVLQLIEAYTTAIECCNLFDFKRLANHYLETAMSQ